MTTTQLTSNSFSLVPSGPFDLTAQSEHFGGWLAAPEPDSGVVMTFPLEGTEESAAVVVRQTPDGSIAGEVHSRDPATASRAWHQALATVSLDVDGADWPKVGSRDPVLGRLQERYGCLRPTLFHSPYEAAAAFVIGHRRTIMQTRATRARIATEIGTMIDIDGRQFHAFPDSRPAAGRRRGPPRRRDSRCAAPRDRPGRTGGAAGALPAAGTAARGGTRRPSGAAWGRAVLRSWDSVSWRRDDRRPDRRFGHAVRDLRGVPVRLAACPTTRSTRSQRPGGPTGRGRACSCTSGCGGSVACRLGIGALVELGGSRRRAPSCSPLALEGQLAL